MRIRGANRREGFGWKIRASHVGLDGEGGTWNLGPDRGSERGVWERWWDVGEMSVERRWDIGGMSCTEKWRDRGYDGEVNRSKVQEIRGLEGIRGVGARA